jgi:ABC-2 type transport system ATP-binding protein
MIRELAEGGMTVFLTTQYMDEAEQLADRISILHSGRIVAEGSAAEIKALAEGEHTSLEDAFLAILEEHDERGAEA